MNMFTQQSSKSKQFQQSEQFRTVQCDSIIVLIDEADLTYHPEWQRVFIALLTAFLPKVYPPRCCQNIQIVLSTHSPILLSDVPQRNVIYLKYNQEKHCTVVDDSAHTGTFGQNVHLLFKDSFFLEKGIIGLFAQRKMEDLVRNLKKIEGEIESEKSKPEEDKFEQKESKQNERRHTSPEYRLEHECKPYAELIAEPIIRRRVLMWIETLEQNLLRHNENNQVQKMTDAELEREFIRLQDVDISDMFDFKYKEDVEECFSQLKVSKIASEDDSIIDIKCTDDLIDLSPCIGIYQEAVFFENYQIEAAIKLKILLNPELTGLYTKSVKNSSLDQKILFLVSLETKQKRYRTQVVTPFVNKEENELIRARLRTRLNGDENAQVECQIDFVDRKNQEVMFSAKGFADVVKEDIVYELKFVSELIHEHFLQCASYMVAMNLQKGILWNTRDNTSYEIEVPDRKAFLDAVAKAVTKGAIGYYAPGLSEEKAEGYTIDQFAVIDTETNWNDEVMSIGVVVADSKTKQKIDSAYYIIDPEYRVGGMYADELRLNEKGACIADRGQALKEIKKWLDTYHVQKLFAYNASFDKKHLPEYANYEWYDIMRLAAYRQYNRAIPGSADCYGTGRLKCGYGVENILKMLGGNKGYRETHNAVLDAEDELQIMQLLGHEISKYNVALISGRKIAIVEPQKSNVTFYRGITNNNKEKRDLV